MLHLTRWRVVGATAVTATTAVLAAGALGLTSSLAGPPSGPDPIELESIDTSTPARPVPIDDGPAASDDPGGPDEPGDPDERGPSEASTPGSSTPEPSGAAPRTAPDDDRIVSPQGPVVQEPAPPPPSPASAESPSSVSSPSSIDS